MTSIPGYTTLKRQARKARRDAEDTASRELFAWHKAEKERLDTDASLSIAERQYQERQLLMEFGRRSKRLLAKAKRDNTVPKLLERSARAEIEAKREELDG
ncbi:hypothetical protein [Agromyces humatus]|uniref:Uncharacterized protein n=1 Tax=Agromyces humatus TaxID=279573 RepID=A0ABN2KWW2_9MICO|nr:hypothetical protein [Agromyces humatus]